jgi:endonuclease III
VQDHKDNKQTVEWCTKYNQVNSQSKVGSRLDENMLLLIKYFISSNNSLVELTNKYFKKLMVKAKIKTPNYRTFVNKFLPEVMKQIHEATLSKLNLATSISLITDILTYKQLKDFIAVAANIINEKFNKELLVIGFTRMP